MYLDWVEMSYNKFPTFNNSFDRDRYESRPYIEEEYEDEELDEDELQD